MKKIIALVLALVTVLSLCAACGAKGSENGPSNSKDKTDSNKTGITLTIGLPTNALVLDYKNNALTKYLEEQTGYNLEFRPFAAGAQDYKMQLTTAVTGGLEHSLSVLDQAEGHLRMSQRLPLQGTGHLRGFHRIPLHEFQTGRGIVKQIPHHNGRTLRTACGRFFQNRTGLQPQAYALAFRRFGHNINFRHRCNGS